jgi:hypothetical protein
MLAFLLLFVFKQKASQCCKVHGIEIFFRVPEYTIFRVPEDTIFRVPEYTIFKVPVM